MILVTGAAGFIGANAVLALQARGVELAVADDFRRLCGTASGPDEWSRFRHGGALRARAWVDKDDLCAWLADSGRDARAVLHLGACSDTTVTDRAFTMRVNLEYSQRLWEWCARNERPFVYASSAATYGDGSAGYDDEANPRDFRPLNLYGESKQRFDLWALEQRAAPPRWAGLKFFNVYGPREAHKGRMASVAYHAWRQIRAEGRVRLFQSHRAGIPHGGQRRDFLYVADAVAAALHFLETPAGGRAPNGLYNVGTGQARSFEDLARAVFSAVGRAPEIEYIPLPEDLREKYQYFTEARVEKLRRAGAGLNCQGLEAGVRAYAAWLAEAEGERS